jgi:hypothetical protein
MFQQHGFALRMGGKQPDRFRSAVAPETDDTDWNAHGLFIHRNE